MMHKFIVIILKNVKFVLDCQVYVHYKDDLYPGQDHGSTEAASDQRIP